MAEKPMVNQKDWNEFRNSGLLLFINQILHVFGWAIVFEFEDDYSKETDTGTVKSVYPARVRFRGFNSDSVGKSYEKITEHLKENVDDLLEEAKE